MSGKKLGFATITFQVPIEMQQQLKELAGDRDYSISVLMRKICRQSLEAERKAKLARVHSPALAMVK